MGGAPGTERAAHMGGRRMTEAEQIADYQRRYAAALHAVQAGVALAMNYDPLSTTPKHLRVGVNSALVNQGALVKLLIAKGVITELEYVRELALMAEAEQARYEAEISAHYGGTTKVKLV